MASNRELAPLIVTLELNQKAFAKQMKDIAKLSADTAKKVDASFANDNFGNSFAQNGQKVVTSLNAQRAAAANLSFQLNDITQGLMSGTSPFTLMAQQGSQVAQALQSTGGGLKAIGGIVAGAVGQLINPVTALTYAAIYFGGKAVEAFSGTSKEAGKATDEVDKHLAALEQIAEKWKDAAPEMAAYFKGLAEARKKDADLAEIAVQRAKEIEPVKAGAQAAAIGAVDLQGTGLEPGELDKISEAVAKINKGIADVNAGTGNIDEVNADIKALIARVDELRKTSDSAPLTDFRQGVVETQKSLTQVIPNVKMLDEFVQELQANMDPARIKALADGLKQLGDIAKDEVPDGMKAAAEATEEAAKAQQILVDTLQKLGGDLAATSQAFDAYNAALQRIGIKQQVDQQKYLNDEAKKYQQILQEILEIGGHHKSDMDKLSDKLSEIIGKAHDYKTAAEAWAAAFGAGDVVIQEQSKSVTDMLKKFEGFRPKAYWDVDHFRVGFGSDEYIDEMGKVQKVTKDTVVTLDQANRDLARRIPIFQATIQRQISPDVWKSLGEQQQAALTSVAYNYGHLPDAIVQAIQTGDKGKVANAIANLTVNPGRRKIEAEAYGGDQFTAKTEKQSTAYDDLVKKIDAATVAKQKEATINSDSTLTADQKVAALDKEKIAVETARIQQELLTAAEAQGLPITDALRASILAKATAAATAGVTAQNAAQAEKQAAKDQKTAAQELARSADQFASMATSFMTGFISDLRNGKSATEALTNSLTKLADQLLDMALNSVFKSLFGGFSGGGAATLGTGGLFHRGGIVGSGTGTHRPVDPRVFVGAPRYHSGGVVGLRSGEVPAILQKGERVIPRGGNTSRGGGDTRINVGNISVATQMDGSGDVRADSERGRKFGQTVQGMIQAELAKQSRPGGLLTATGSGGRVGR